MVVDAAIFNLFPYKDSKKDCGFIFVRLVVNFNCLERRYKRIGHQENRFLLISLLLHYLNNLYKTYFQNIILYWPRNTFQVKHIFETTTTRNPRDSSLRLITVKGPLVMDVAEWLGGHR